MKLPYRRLLRLQHNWSISNNAFSSHLQSWISIIETSQQGEIMFDFRENMCIHSIFVLKERILATILQMNMFLRQKCWTARHLCGIPSTFFAAILSLQYRQKQCILTTIPAGMCIINFWSSTVQVMPTQTRQMHSPVSHWRVLWTIVESVDWSHWDVNSSATTEDRSLNPLLSRG